MTQEKKTAVPRNHPLNFLPIATIIACAIAGWGETLMGRMLLIVHILAFYSISIWMVFRKNFSKLVILLIVFPATAVFTYLVMLFLRPREPNPTTPETPARQ